VLQSVVISKEQFPSLEAARKRAETFGKTDKVDETPNTYRFRQRDPGDFRDGSFRNVTKDSQPNLPEGVILVMAKLK